MKRIIITSFLYLFCIGIYAQKSLVDEAIKHGSDERGIYHIKNSKKKAVTYEQTASYLKKNGYTLISGTSMRVHRFGDVSTILDYCDFTDSQTHSAYLFWVMSGKTSYYNILQEKGSFFLPMKERVVNGIVETTVTKLKLWGKILWSGPIVDGLIDGSGEGFIKTDSGDDYWIRGSFDNGIPISSVQMSFARNSNVNDISSEKYNEATAQICVQSLDTNDPLLQKALHRHAEETYEQDARKIEQAYQKAKTLNTSNYGQFNEGGDIIAYGDVVSLIAFYGHNKINYDPKHILPKAKEVEMAHQVIAALQMKIRDSYYVFGKFLVGPWLAKDVSSDENCLNAGLTAARNGKSDAKYGLHTFFSGACELLETKKVNFDKKISSDKAECNAIIARQEGLAKQSFEETKKAREKFENENRIDKNKCKEPSGDLVRGTLSSEYHYLNSGEIVRKDGKKFVYNEWFDYNKKHDYYIINDGPGLYMNKYKSWDDMIKAIENF